MQCHFSSLFTLTISSFNYDYKWNLFSSASKAHILQVCPISRCLFLLTHQTHFRGENPPIRIPLYSKYMKNGISFFILVRLSCHFVLCILHFRYQNLWNKMLTTLRVTANVWGRWQHLKPLQLYPSHHLHSGPYPTLSQ